MHVTLKRQIFCHSQCYLWCDQTLYDRVICQVQEHDNVIGYPAFRKGMAEIFCNIIFYTHRSKYNREFLIRVIPQRCLTHDLCSQLVMRQTVSGENRQLLSADQGRQTIDRRNTGTDIVTGIFSGYRI